MMRDEKGFFYFVDRVGDTFRWKGENVSTTEVAEAIRKCRGIVDAAVYGVMIPGTEGRAGMAALIVDVTFDIHHFRRQLVDQLPDYARPLFIRLVKNIDHTGTHKLQTNYLASQGYDPNNITDTLYFDDKSADRYIKLDNSLYDSWKFN